MSVNTMPEEKGKLTGFHVLMWIIGFFAVVIAVNGVFLYSAITSFPGEDVKKSYLQGLHYNDTLAARNAQSALGWTAAAGLVTDGVAGPELRVELRDAAGRALSTLDIDVTLRRAATTDADTRLPLEAVGPGLYGAPTGDLAPGRWEAIIHVRDGETLKLEATKSFLVS